jgi:tryptophanyl-tRNA synthetase
MLTCVTPVGWLERMTQYKAKSAAQRGLPHRGFTLPFGANARIEGEMQLSATPDGSTIGDGLLQYPVLMAADILLYQAAIVPVGDDQSQHLELTRDIAQRFNSLYPDHGNTFVVPQTHLPTVGARIMGLDEPDKKMSKSAVGTGHAVSLLDPPEVIRKKFLRATTDSNPAVDFETAGAGVRNLLAIFQSFTECSDEALRTQFAGMRYGDLKKTVAEAVIAALEPIQKRYREITAETGYVARVLEDGAQKVRPIANDTVEKVKRVMGLYTP